MANLSAANAARLTAALGKKYRFDGNQILTLGQWLDKQRSNGPLETVEHDGFIKWSRRKFNGMNGDEQRDYEARLKAQRHFYINGVNVPKIVYDVVVVP